MKSWEEPVALQRTPGSLIPVFHQGMTLHLFWVKASAPGVTPAVGIWNWGSEEPAVSPDLWLKTTKWEDASSLLGYRECPWSQVCCWAGVFFFFFLVHLCVKSVLTVDEHLFEQKVSPVFCVHIRSSCVQGNKGRRMGRDWALSRQEWKLHSNAVARFLPYMLRSVRTLVCHGLFGRVGKDPLDSLIKA